jgi:hypothetical protein
MRAPRASAALQQPAARRVAGLDGDIGGAAGEGISA